MTKRAKLNLTPNEQNVEKQEASFHTDDDKTRSNVDLEQNTQYEDEPVATSSTSSEQKTGKKTQHNDFHHDSTEQDDEDSTGITSRSKGKVLLKAALVVGVAAVAVYLIRRRFR